jgi:hypothetical protein
MKLHFLRRHPDLRAGQVRLESRCLQGAATAGSYLKVTEFIQRQNNPDHAPRVHKSRAHRLTKMLPFLVKSILSFLWISTLVYSSRGWYQYGLLSSEVLLCSSSNNKFLLVDVLVRGDSSPHLHIVHHPSPSFYPFEAYTFSITENIDVLSA